MDAEALKRIQLIQSAAKEYEVSVYDDHFTTHATGMHLFSIYDIGNAFKAGGIWADRHSYNHWVSVNEGFPTTERSVLVFNGIGLHVAYWLESGQCWCDPYDNWKEYKHVTHWCELPMMPKTKM
jgi:hypothetical protein